MGTQIVITWTCDECGAQESETRLIYITHTYADLIVGEPPGWDTAFSIVEDNDERLLCGSCAAASTREQEHKQGREQQPK